MTNVLPLRNERGTARQETLHTFLPDDITWLHNPVERRLNVSSAVSSLI